MKSGTLLLALWTAGLLCFPAGAASGAGWTIESADSQGLPIKYTSLKTDSQGNVHVAYVIDDQNHYPLRYAFWDHSLKRWFTMTVDQNVGTCSLAIDSKQHPHISYTDFAGGRLRYAFWDGLKWTTQVVPLNSENINYYQGIALTPDDRPGISFYEYRGPKDSDLKIRLRTVMWDGKVWALRTVDSDEGSGKFNAIAADSQGHLHIAYANVSAGTGGMRYAFWDGKTWKTEILEGEKENNGHGVGYSCNIVLDSEANPHLTYMDEVERIVKYAVRKNGSWRIQPIARVRGVGYPDRNSIALDSHGVPYISYFDAGAGSLHLTHPAGDKWVIETVDTDGAGFTPSLQIDGDTIWISYADGGNGLKVARRPLNVAAATGESATAGHSTAKN